MDDDKDQLIQVIEGASNFLLGMTLDARLHPDIRAAVVAKAKELDVVVESFLRKETTHEPE